MFDRFFLWLSRRIKAAERRAAPRIAYDVEAAYEKLRRERDPEYPARPEEIIKRVQELTAGVENPQYCLKASPAPTEDGTIGVRIYLAPLEPDLPAA